MPFSDQYTVVAGERAGRALGWRARPVVGGHFAELAMEGAGLFRGEGFSNTRA